MEYSEEEKKAIEEAKKQILECKNLNNINIFLTNSTTLKTLLNLIEKQQKDINKKDKRYDNLANGAIEAVFSKMNYEVEILARVLHKQGQIKFDKERQEYINPMKEFELCGAKYTKNKVILDEDNYIPKEAIREKIEKLKEEKEQLRIEKEVTWDSGIYKLDLKINILKELLGEYLC